MSDTELLSSAIVSHIHEIQAGTTPLLVEFKLIEVPLGIFQQVYTVFTKLTEIKDKVQRNCTDLGGQEGEAIYEDLFMELKSESRKLHRVISLLIEGEEVGHEGNVRYLMKHLDKTLRDSTLLS